VDAHETVTVVAGTPTSLVVALVGGRLRVETRQTE
jgi:hypothetical protein